MTNKSEFVREFFGKPRFSTADSDSINYQLVNVLGGPVLAISYLRPSHSLALNRDKLLKVRIIVDRMEIDKTKQSWPWNNDQYCTQDSVRGSWG